MIISDLTYVDSIAENTDLDGGFSFPSFSSLFSSTSPTALAFTSSSAQATGSNFAIASSTNIAQAFSTPFFAIAFSSSTSIAIAG